MALHGQPVTDIDWKTVTKQEWKEVYVVAAEQGVMALAWDGLQVTKRVMHSVWFHLKKPKSIWK